MYIDMDMDISIFFVIPGTAHRAARTAPSQFLPRGSPRLETPHPRSLQKLVFFIIKNQNDSSNEQKQKSSSQEEIFILSMFMYLRSFPCFCLI